MSAFLSAVLLWAVQVGAATFPATVEVDLIFPRNDTYAPSTLFPIVFAFQNAALASSLEPAFDMVLWDSTFNHTRNPTLNVKWNNFSNEPTFVYTYVSRLNTTADGAPTPYTLVWDFGAGNCSNEGPGGAWIQIKNPPLLQERSSALFVGGGFRAHGVTFTIQNGAQKPDLVAATANSALCTNASHFAFNLTGTLDVGPEQYGGRNTCAVLSDVQPLVHGDPCAVHVDSATASSISAAITATACAVPSPIVSCPSKQSAAGDGWSAAKTGFPAMLGGFVAALVAMQLL